ncbi:Mediator of RNA polymerase II transcription subunit 8 [Sphaceloma murrayae]|uniref:Mediator of RNA polymerase II transcription subunit 8 n=1 Tax=Sphaceloma murrayae TaxID=2082308 RepID=A0A2K1R3J9_9PEZI|nr:Mediator of RNA polymerase II transcription subunit 8 [Sphaceloma murrayae]
MSQAPEAIRTLEQVRQRLNNLSVQLASLRRDLEVHELLPSWATIQNSANLLSHNLASLHETLSSAQPLLTAAHAYPLPSYPARTQEHSLIMLMRKKLQPPVEDWIEEGAKHGTLIVGHDTVKQPNGITTGVAKTLGPTELDDLWEWAGPEGNRLAREIGEEAFEDVFTLAEQEAGIENVVTGLRRKFWESDDEDDDDDDNENRNQAADQADAMDLDAPDTRPDAIKKMDRLGTVDQSRSMLPLEAILKFTNTGILPPGVAIPAP